MKIIAISDTHNRHAELKIPKCDVLIFAGDATFVGNETEMESFFQWFREQPAQYLVFVPGNHEVGYYHKGDWRLQGNEEGLSYGAPYIHVLVDRSITINGKKIYGSPWTYVSPKWGFQFPWYEIDLPDHYQDKRATQIKTWESIPQDVDILVTHTPPKGILDIVPHKYGRAEAGDSILMLEILKRPSIKYHFFGHIHEAYGKARRHGKKFYNVAVCDRSYYANNKITVVNVK